MSDDEVTWRDRGTGGLPPAGDEQARAAAEELAKRLAVAWWSAEGMTKGHPEANNALWFCTEHVEMWWSKATEQQPFFLAMATVLLPVMAVRVADAVAQAVKERAFPVIVQHVYRGEAAHPLRIPWSLAERAYSVYAAKYGKSQSLEQLAERGGFHASELDEYVPGWPEEVSLVTKQAEQIRRLHKEIDEVCDPNLRDAEAEIARLRREAVAVHENQERLFMRVSNLLTGGNASTWDELQHAAMAVTAERERTRLLRETVAELVTRGEHLAEEHMVAEDDPHAGSHMRAFNDALDNVTAALRAPGPFVNTMLGQPITAAERDRISKDGP